MSSLEADGRYIGLEESDIARLAILKGRVDTGDCNELTLDFKRLDFLGYLVANGKVGEGVEGIIAPKYTPPRIASALDGYIIPDV